jgi:hypothetical protein
MGKIYILYFIVSSFSNGLVHTTQSEYISLEACEKKKTELVTNAKNMGMQARGVCKEKNLGRKTL